MKNRLSASRNELGEILPVALATESGLDRDSHEWESPADFPEVIGTWFRRQREILFRGMSICGAGDVMLVYRRPCATTKGSLEGNLPLAEMIYGLIKKQARMTEKLPKSTVDNLIYYGFRPFDVVEAICFTYRQPLPPYIEVK